LVRQGRFGAGGETLEPNLKEAVGGLRDVQALGWLVSVIDGSPRPRNRVGRAQLERIRRTEKGVRKDEGNTVLLVRVALHRVNGGSSDVLGADQQPAVAELLGLPDEEGWEARDVLMRDLSAAHRFIACACDEYLGNPWYWVDSLSRDPLKRLRKRLKSYHRPTDSAPGELAGIDRPLSALAADAVEISDPTLYASIGALEGRSVSQGLVPFERWSTAVRHGFFGVLTGEANARALREMDVFQLLQALLPEWVAVRGRPQRDPYHRYPVDIHLIETAAEAARSLREPDEPFAVEAARLVEDPAALLLGALLHDIGKVGRGSHVSLGADIAGQALDRMGVTAGVGDDVLFLAREHLLLSDTATRRSLEDEGLVLHVAARIRDPRRLALLYLLTVADARATGPAASSPWRLGLIRELVAKVSHAFERGLMTGDRAERLEVAETEMRSALAEAAVPSQDAESFVSTVPADYLLWAEPRAAVAHLPLIVPRPEAAEARIATRPGAWEGSYEAAVGAVDRLGLLAAVAGSMALSGLSILSCRAFTTESGLALDVFDVRGAFEPEVGPDRWDRFRAFLRPALAGQVDLSTRVQELRAHYRPAASDFPTSVRVDQDASDFCTVVEVSAPDRLGLLFELASAFAELGIDVHSAKVATYGPRVIDVFYVRDGAGQKLVETGEIENALITAAGSDRSGS